MSCLSLCVSIYICMCLHLYIFVSVCIHLSGSMSVSLCVCLPLCMSVYIYLCMCVVYCMSLCLFVFSCMYVCLHVLAAGRMQVLYSDLPRGQEDDRWHHLMQGNSRTARGSLRLGVLFKDLVILPVEEYSELKEV